MNARLPFFTAPDPQLLRADSGRDPLGLLPVWGEFGRRLVPRIAGPVGQLKGVMAVLVIHYVYQQLFAKDPAGSATQFRRCFRLMEGVLEHYLALSNAHCYGILTFKAGKDFTVGAKDSSTAVNGLYQYYRGTCDRAQLIDGRALAPDAARQLDQHWNQAALKALEQALRASLRDGEARLSPGELLAQQPALLAVLDATFASQGLKALLHDTLFGDTHHRALAHLCLTLRQERLDSDGRSAVSTLELVAGLRQRLAAEPAHPAYPLLDNVTHVAYCEPFLVTVQDCFDYLRRSNGMRVDDVAKELGHHAAPIRQRARVFLQLEDVAKGPRSRQLLDLASAALDSLTAFLQAILAHHQAIMAERGRDPMVLLEPNGILSLSQPGRSATAIHQRLKDCNPWDNGYYLATAAKLYQQAAV